MKLHFTSFLFFIAALSGAQSVVDFEEFNLSPESFLNGSDGSGGFVSGDVFLPNTYDSQWMSWAGWAISNTTDTATPGFSNQYSAIAGGGYDGSAHYAVTYAFGNNNIILQGDAAGNPVSGMYVTNNTYAYWSMLEGDAFSKKFGGLTGNDPDYFLLTIKAWHNGALSADSLDFYLADYRFSDNSQDYVVDEWEWVDLSALGPADSLAFTLRSTDVGQFGINTPAFFCVDHISVSGPSGAKQAAVPIVFDIFPNPAAAYVQVSSAENEALHCAVFDLRGNLVLQKQLNAGGGQLDLQSLPQGNYVVRVRDERGRSSGRIVCRQ
jgi:hypothetical protein